jgi:membrane associated rhomboid family serine protease
MLPLKDHNPTFSTPFVTYALVGINVLVMLMLGSMAPLAQQKFVVENGFIPARLAQLADPNQKVEVPIQEQVVQPNGKPALRDVGKVEFAAAPGAILLSLLTTMFIHGGWMHLAGNMWFLWIFGNNIEDRLGHVLYAVFYLVGGLMATGCHWAYDPHSMIPVVGASGAVSAVLGAYAVTYPKATVSTLVFFGFITIIEIPAVLWLIVWLAGQLLDASFQKDLGVAVWAHIGGFVAGAVAMPILSLAVSPPGPSADEDEFMQYFTSTGSDQR